LSPSSLISLTDPVSAFSSTLSSLADDQTHQGCIFHPTTTMTPFNAKFNWNPFVTFDHNVITYSTQSDYVSSTSNPSYCLNTNALHFPAEPSLGEGSFIAHEASVIQLALNFPHPPPTRPISNRHLCPWPSGCTESFTRRSDLERHWQSVHFRIRYHCFIPVCGNNHGKGYCRFEKLRSHQREKHGFHL